MCIIRIPSLRAVIMVNIVHIMLEYGSINPFVVLKGSEPITKKR